MDLCKWIITLYHNKKLNVSYYTKRVWTEDPTCCYHIWCVLHTYCTISSKLRPSLSSTFNYTCFCLLISSLFTLSSRFLDHEQPDVNTTVCVHPFVFYAGGKMCVIFELHKTRAFNTLQVPLFSITHSLFAPIHRVLLIFISHDSSHKDHSRPSKSHKQRPKTADNRNGTNRYGEINNGQLHSVTNGRYTHTHAHVRRTTQNR